jgi:hypothetical protein
MTVTVEVLFSIAPSIPLANLATLVVQMAHVHQKLVHHQLPAQLNPHTNASTAHAETTLKAVLPCLFAQWTRFFALMGPANHLETSANPILFAPKPLQSSVPT